MVKAAYALIASSTFAALTAGSAGAASSPAAEIASRAYLVGNWSCSYTVGKTAGTYKTSWATTLDGKWLTQSIDQGPVQKSMMNDADPTTKGFKASYFIGYDERRQGWVRFGAMTTGQYFTIRMTDDGRRGWIYDYVSLFPSTRTPPPGGDAAFKRISDTRYTIDGPTYPLGGGPLVTEHHVCIKQ